MAYHASGYRQIGPMGQPAANSPAGSVKQLHSFVTADDRAAVETSGYFNALLTPAKKIQLGDLLIVSFGVGTNKAGTRTYQLDIVSNAVVLRAELDDAGTPVRSITATADGLTTGIILDTDEFVEVTSANANNIVVLPLATAATRGREIQIWVLPGTNCELQTPATTNQTINGVDSDGTNEALLTHTQFYVARQHLANGWLLQAFTALGAVATAIVPDP